MTELIEYEIPKETQAFLNRLVEERYHEIMAPSKKKANRRFTSRNRHLYDKNVMNQLKERLIAMYGEICMKCRSVDEIVVDHIQARARGGTNDFSNTQLLCNPCNFEKGLQTADYRPNREIL